jgi:hypothetical protein
MIPWSTPDLSEITLVLKALLDKAIQNSSLPVGNITTSCDSPETARTAGQCYLTLYMLHIGRDPYWRNTPVSGPRPQLNNAQPLSLTLSYLLTAYCEKDFVLEQRAMSIALQAIHSNPIIAKNIIQSDDPSSPLLPNCEFLISIEADTIEEMSRLWQAFIVPIRLSALIRASVVFVAPDSPMPFPAVPPSIANLSVSPNLVVSPDPAPPTKPLLFAGASLQSPPVPPSADPSQIASVTGPLVAVAGSTLTVTGTGLDLVAAAEVFLSVPGTTTEWNVTNPWRQGVEPGKLDLLLPAGYADPATSLPPPPDATPAPGLYNLTVGSGTFRSNAIAVVIAPQVAGVTDPPLLKPNAGLYVIRGAGFVPSTATTLKFGSVMLNYSAAATPGVGEFIVNATATGITFQAPSAAPGEYPVLLAVNGFAASTGWVAVVQ